LDGDCSWEPAAARDDIAEEWRLAHNRTDSLSKFPMSMFSRVGLLQRVCEQLPDLTLSLAAWLLLFAYQFRV
jgi:hypothetical protein